MNSDLQRVNIKLTKLQLENRRLKIKIKKLKRKYE